VYGIRQAVQSPLGAQVHWGLKPLGPQQEDSGTLLPDASLAAQLHTLLMDLNLPLGSSSCRHAYKFESSALITEQI
jgi:hypothetical protein